MGLPLPIPGAVYGLLLMFTALCTKIVKLEQVEDAGQFLLETMTVMFTPPAVGLISMWGVLRDVWVQVLIIVVLTTFIVMFVTGHVAQFVMRLERRKTPLAHTYLHPDDPYEGEPGFGSPGFSRHSEEKATEPARPSVSNPAPKVYSEKHRGAGYDVEVKGNHANHHAHVHATKKRRHAPHLHI